MTNARLREKIESEVDVGGRLPTTRTQQRLPSSFGKRASSTNERCAKNQARRRWKQLQWCVVYGKRRGLAVQRRAGKFLGCVPIRSQSQDVGS